MMPSEYVPLILENVIPALAGLLLGHWLGRRDRASYVPKK